MKIDTKFFGEIVIDESSIIKFQGGIPGFEALEGYTLLDLEGKKFRCLQSIDDKEICFLVINPWDYFKEYEISLSDSETNELEIKDQKQVLVFNILTVHGSNITTNLSAPIIINVLNNKGKQIVLTNSKYSIREIVEEC